MDKHVKEFLDEIKARFAASNTGSITLSANDWEFICRKFEYHDEELGSMYDQGIECVQSGQHELYIGEDEQPDNLSDDDIPEDSYEKPFANFHHFYDPGDPSVGLQGWSGWVLSKDQAGTVLEDILKKVKAK